MKQLSRILLIVLLLGFYGCATPKVIVYQRGYPAKAIDSQIDIYNTQKPEKKYIEIAEISCGDTDESYNMKQLLIKAREVGADGLIMTGKAGSYGAAFGNTGAVYGATEEYGLRAIAIKYIISP